MFSALMVIFSMRDWQELDNLVPRASYLFDIGKAPGPSLQKKTKVLSLRTFVLSSQTFFFKGGGGGGGMK